MKILLNYDDYDDTLENRENYRQIEQGKEEPQDSEEVEEESCEFNYAFCNRSMITTKNESSYDHSFSVA